MPLSIEEQSLLYSTITGDRDIKYLFLHLEKQMQIMLSKPFFVLSMHCSKQNLKIGPKQTWILLLLLLKKH